MNITLKVEICLEVRLRMVHAVFLFYYFIIIFFEHMFI
jgi:hypothetical protein